MLVVSFQSIPSWYYLLKKQIALLRQYLIAAARVSVITAIERVAVDNSSSRVVVNHSHSKTIMVDCSSNKKSC